MRQSMPLVCGAPTRVWVQAWGMVPVCRTVCQRCASADHHAGGRASSESAVQPSPPAALPRALRAARRRSWAVRRRSSKWPVLGAGGREWPRAWSCCVRVVDQECAGRVCCVWGCPEVKPGGCLLCDPLLRVQGDMCGCGGWWWIWLGWLADPFALLHGVVLHVCHPPMDLEAVDASLECFCRGGGWAPIVLLGGAKETEEPALFDWLLCWGMFARAVAL
eukprot:s3371_g6.t1